MSHSHRNRGNRQSAQIAVSAIAEIVEPRMLLSAVPVAWPASLPGVDAAVGTKELVVVAEINEGGGAENPKIDEIRLEGDEVQVFASIYSQRTWPSGLDPVYVLASSTQDLLWSGDFGPQKSAPRWKNRTHFAARLLRNGDFAPSETDIAFRRIPSLDSSHPQRRRSGIRGAMECGSDPDDWSCSNRCKCLNRRNVATCHDGYFHLAINSNDRRNSLPTIVLR